MIRSVWMPLVAASFLVACNGPDESTKQVANTAQFCAKEVDGKIVRTQESDCKRTVNTGGGGGGGFFWYYMGMMNGQTHNYYSAPAYGAPIANGSRIAPTTGAYVSAPAPGATMRPSVVTTPSTRGGFGSTASGRVSVAT